MGGEEEVGDEQRDLVPPTPPGRALYLTVGWDLQTNS